MNLKNMNVTDLNSGKVFFLEGIRGLMACNVIICHFVCVYIPQMYFIEYAESEGDCLSLFATTSLSVLVNGNIAVQFFFVLTGFLVGKSYFTKEISAKTLFAKTIKRYFRLLPVVFVATVFTYFTMIFNMQRHLDIVPYVRNGPFLESYCNFEPTITNLISSIFVDPFFRGSSRYIGPFWTIQFEFWGYILSMVACFTLKNSKIRRIGYAAIAGLIYLRGNNNYIPFVMGVFVADLEYNRAKCCFGPVFDKWIHKKVMIYGLLLLGLFFCTCPIYFTSVYVFLESIPYMETSVIRAVGISFVLFAILSLPKIQSIFQKPILLSLGKYSYELYAIHWPVMLSIQAWIFLNIMEYLPYYVAASLSFFATLPVIYIFSVGIQKGIEQIKCSKYIKILRRLR